MSITEKALKAKADAETLIKTAIDEQLGVIKEAQKRLKALGYENLSPGAPPKLTSNGKVRRQRTAESNKPCPICKVVTKPNHDGRMHRGQKRKLKFTAGEMKEFGLS